MYANPVRVCARTHPMSEDWETWAERPGISLARIIRRLQVGDGAVGVTLNGRIVRESQWTKTRAKAGDLVNLKVVPQGSPSQWLGLGIGVGSLALLWALGGGGSKATASTQNNPISPAPEPPVDPPLPPEDNYGGPASSITPAIMGVSNRKSNWGPVPSILGTCQVAPVVIADPYILTEGSTQWLYVAMTFGLGPLDITDIKIGDKNIDDLVAAGVCQYELRYGTPEDYLTPLTLYTRDVNTVLPGRTLTAVAQTEVAGQQANQLSVDIEVSGLTAQRRLTSMTGPGLVINYSPNDPFTAVPHTVTFSIEYRLHGSADAWTSRSLSRTANTSETMILGDTWTVATPGLYDVRITKTSSDASYTLNESVPGGLTAVYTITPIPPTATWKRLLAIRTAAPISYAKDVNGDYHPWAFIVLKIKESELTGSTIDNLTAICKRHVQTWDGNAWTAPVQTNSIPYAIAEVLTGKTNNCRIGKEMIDTDSFAEAEEWCVLNGFEYSKPIDQFTEPYELVEEIARHGLCSINAVDGKFALVIDKPKTDIVQVFAGANTNNLEVSGGWRDRPHGVKVKFMNPDADWNPDERTVFDDGYTENNATRFESLEYPGETSADAAYILGRRHIAATKLRRKRYTLECDWQHLVAKRGDLCKLNYDVSFDGLGSSLIKSVIDDGTDIIAIELEQPVIMEDGKEYGFQVRFADHTFSNSVEVITEPGKTRTLTLAEPMPLDADSIPAHGDLVIFGIRGMEGRLVLIDEIEYMEDLAARLTFVDYAPGVFTAAEGAIPPYTPNVNRPHPTRAVIDPPVITGTISDESVLLRAGNGIISRIQLSLAPPTAQSVALTQMQYKLSSEETWLKGPSDSLANGNVAYLTGVTDGASYDIQVRYSTRAGRTSAWTSLNNYTVVGKSSKPPDIPRIVPQGVRAWIKYDQLAGVTVPLDHAGFQIRWAQGPTIVPWDQMNILFARTTSHEVALGGLPNGAIQLAAKAVDTVGNMSENAAYLTLSLDTSFEQNLFEEFPEHTAWAGTKTNATIEGGELWAIDAGTLHFKEDPASKYFKPNPSSLHFDTAYLPLTYEWTFTPDGSYQKPYRIFLAWEVEGDGYFVEYKRNSQQLFFNQDGSAPFFKSDPGSLFFNASANVWYPFPQEGLEGTREEFSFRIRVLAGNARPKIKSATVRVDVPDVEEDLPEVEVLANGGAGTVLPLTKTYRQIKIVVPNYIYDPVNYPDAFQVGYTISEDGKTVTARVFDTSGAIVDGLASFRVKGT